MFVEHLSRIQIGTIYSLYLDLGNTTKTTRTITELHWKWTMFSQLHEINCFWLFLSSSSKLRHLHLTTVFVWSSSCLSFFKSFKTVPFFGFHSWCVHRPQADVEGHVLQIAVIPAPPWVIEKTSPVSPLEKHHRKRVSFESVWHMVEPDLVFVETNSKKTESLPWFMSFVML